VYEAVWRALRDAGVVYPSHVARREVRDDDETRGLIERMRVVEASGLTERYPGQWGGWVELRDGSGAGVMCEVLAPFGSAERPLDWDDLREKHARAGWAPAALDAAFRRCRTMGAGGRRV
jgi:2-methylcitrate dehydratase PrpD